MTTLIGTNPDQIPVNSMLGGMAYQDPDSINVKDFNSSGTANIASLVSPTASITNLSYSGTLTGGTGVINIGSNQIYKDASGNVGLGAVPISNGKTLTLVNTTTNPSSFYLQNSTTGFTTTDGTLLQLAGSAAYLWNFENSTLSLATNNTEFVRLTSTGDLLNLGTGATKLQEGTTAQRPASPQEGMIRKNSTLGVIEGYSGGGYVSLEAGRLIARTVYSSPGSFTWTPNAKTKHTVLVLISGGGGSGGCPPTNASQGAMSTPGANGQFVRCEIPRDSTFGTSYSVVVGTGGVFGVKGASPTNGTAGGASSVTNNTSSAVISITGGDYGAAGFATSTFPIIQTNLGPSSLTNTGGHFVVWERAVVTITQAMLFNTIGSIWYDMKPLIAGMGSSVAKGGGGYPGACTNSDPDGSDGQSGSAGEVIIYEYS
jgi:hypothetical protein